MIEKRVTAIVYGSDRNLWSGGPLQIRVSDLLAAGGPRLLSSARTDSATVELRLQLPHALQPSWPPSLESPLMKVREMR